MAADQHLVALTSSVSELKQVVLNIREVYVMFLPLIEQEHEAIRSGNLDAVEEVADKKIDLGNQLDNYFLVLRQAALRVLDQFVEITGSQDDTEIATLSDLFPLVEKIIHLAKQPQLNTEVLEHTLAGLRTALLEFAQLKEQTTRHIEVNRQVLARLLHSRQENYKFWQEVAADMMASYNSGGRQRAKATGSTLNVKA